MNYLAHTLLSCHDPSILLGNFLADMMTKKDIDRLPAQFKEGVVLHKIIDQYTDEHPSVRKSVRVLRPTQGKYSPVTIDILYDHFLSVSWTSYSDEPLNDFTARVYDILLKSKDQLPEKYNAAITAMVSGDFLMSCSTEERLIRTFDRVRARASFANNFDRAHLDLRDHRDVLEEHFHDFFPSLASHTTQFCNCGSIDEE